MDGTLNLERDAVAVTFQSANMTRPVTSYYDNAETAVREALALQRAGARIELEHARAPFWAWIEDRRLT